MRDNIEELKCLLQTYDKKNAYKTALIAVICLFAVFAIAAAVFYYFHDCCCDDDFCDFDDDFDDDDGVDDGDDFEEE